jgi:SAM-dependent methyltransferase
MGATRQDDDGKYAQAFARYKPLLKLILNHDILRFGIPLEASVLDIGCGQGEDLARLKKAGYESVIGIDPDAEFVKTARAKGLDVRLGTMEATGIESSSVDVVVVDNVFHHTNSYEADVEELSRVLRPGGKLHFIEPRNSTTRKLLDWLTFKTPLGRLPGPFRTRYDVMINEMNSGLYPQWLRSQDEFFRVLRRDFDVSELKKGAFFWFCTAARSSRTDRNSDSATIHAKDG